MSDLYTTAIHEAAHAVVLYRTTGSANGYTTIIPGSGNLGAAGGSCSDSFSSEHMQGEILSCYAGGAAQRRHDPMTCDDGCEVDDELAAQYLAAQGWSGREQEFRAQAEALVVQHWADICAVADELLRASRLDSTEVEIIVDESAHGAEAVQAALVPYRLLRDSVPAAGRCRRPHPAAAEATAHSAVRHHPADQAIRVLHSRRLAALCRDPAVGSPPKNRSSTTCALRGSSRASATSASCSVAKGALFPPTDLLNYGSGKIGLRYRA
jgi:hypothetical protein